MKCFLFSAFLFLFLLLLPIDAQETYHRVAHDDGGVPGKQPHLLSGDNYTYPGLKEDLDATVAFGNEVSFGYVGLDKEARYRVRIVFVSDGPRVQNLLVNDELLLERIELQKDAAVTETIDLPPRVYEKGEIAVRTQRLEGPNAVVASIEILSTDTAPLSSYPEPPVPDYVLPRLSPRPAAVTGTGNAVLDLTGTWRFHPDPPSGFESSRGSGPGWGDIDVPGQWVQQGYTVDKEKAAAFFRSFDLPADWKGRRIKLRCDGVYSDARIFVNGKQAGSHLGGFTPFELDVSSLVSEGNNTIAMAVRSHTLADTLASGIQYAAHDLGGIPRKLYLFALPEVNVSRLHVETRFDDSFDDAVLTVLLEVANESSRDADGLEAAFSLAEWPNGMAVEMKRAPVALDPLPGGTAHLHEIRVHVSSPKKWHAETPNLYTLTADLIVAGEVKEQVSRRFGFRQVEVKGDRVLVNGRPVKLRGVCRHEVNPLRGRSLRPEDWRRDAELFREANCNYIRTSHYPPAEEFIAACDELGLFVEEEAPLCWVGHGANRTWQTWNPHDDKYFSYIQQCILEMIERDRSHPSVIIWSMANESAWGRNWRFADANAASADPTRPRSFHDQCYGGYNNHGSTRMPVANMHYPGPKGAKNAETIPRPLLFGEYSHLNAYNRHELITDPGVRDAWGRGFNRMWETMQSTDGILGGAIWSGIDDSFFLPGGLVVGYGTWGPIDGWRRQKPEFWHVKKSYSPVRIDWDAIAMQGGVLRIPVENRHDVTNLKDLEIKWISGGQRGKCTCDIAPGERGVLEVPKTGHPLLLSCQNPRGFVIDVFLIAAEPTLSRTTGLQAMAGPAAHQMTGMPAAAEKVEYKIDKSAGKITEIAVKGKPVVLGNPELMILPLDNRGGTQMTGENTEFAPTTQTCSEWRPGKVDIDLEDKGTELVIRVDGAYAEAEGGFELAIDKHGEMKLSYSFTVKKEVNPRQVGMVFTLPRACSVLAWKRKGLWSVYPPDHIGRTEGTAEAFPMEERLGPAGPERKPSHPYSRDTTALGSNDFRSTKENIYWASLRDDDGAGICVVCDAEHHIRAWVDEAGVRLLVARFNNPGAERFFRSHAAMEDRPLKPGDTIEGNFRFHLVSP